MTKQAPEFLIIGAAKAGTTSLVADCNRHPDIFTPGFEVDYFSYNYEQGNAWYRSLFQNDEKVQGEKSPSYLHETSCYEKIFAYNPEMKLIILVREPVKRAFSNWMMRHAQNRLIRQTHAFNQRNPVEISNMGFNSLFQYYQSCTSASIRHQKPLEIFERSQYILQIEKLMNYFHREQLLILVAEHYFSNPGRELGKVSRFLNIGDFPAGEPSWKRKSSYPIKLKENETEEIDEFFRPYNDRLFNFLGYEIPEWKK